MNPPYAPPKKDFLNKPAPPGYVAGVGRGATGFTTRSDLGPAREAIAAATAAAVAGTSSLPDRRTIQAKRDDEEEDEYLNESNYDEFAGYGGSLFNKDPYEEDDQEADKIYEQIDLHLDERGKALREAKNRQELQKYREERPKIQQQFTDLKASLQQVSEEEWMNIPEVGDARNRKQRVARQDKFTPIPDSLLAHQAKIASGGEKLVYIDTKNQPEDDAMQMSDPESGGSDDEANRLDVRPTPASSGLNIGEMSEFRSSYMSMKLNRLNADETVNQTVANPKDYLTNLQSMISNQITDATTLKEYRKQFQALRRSNPTFQNAWIASVRLEEAAGKLKTARSLILEACEHNPKSADLWCEAARLYPRDKARMLMVKALKEDPRSVKLWIYSADLETDDESKRKVYAKAREIVPKSVLLWKKSVELERPEGARKILREAVECCPESVELWLALARLEPYEEARKVLIKASDKNPTDRSIWIMAAKLEEAAGNKALVESIVKRSIEQLYEKGIKIIREEWFQEAIDADRADFKITCREIIKRMIDWDIGKDDSTQENRLNILLKDVDNFLKSKSINCARSVYDCIVDDKNFCKMEKIWLSYIDFEKSHGQPETLRDVLKRSVESVNCNKSETLWLKLADESKKHLSLNDIRQILSDALDSNSDSEKIIIAAVDLECENNNFKEARRILADACMSAKTPELIKKAAKLEWTLGNLDEALRMLKAGAEEFKKFAEFYLMLGQIEEQRNENDKAKAYYAQGLKFNPESVDLWINSALLEEKTGFIPRARSKLEMARIRNPRVPRLWLEASRFEMRAFMSKRTNNSNLSTSSTTPGVIRPDVVMTLLAKGMKECRDHEDVAILYQEQSLINKRKFV